MMSEVAAYGQFIGPIDVCFRAWDSRSSRAPVSSEGREVTFGPGSPGSGRRNVIVPERWARSACW